MNDEGREEEREREDLQGDKLIVDARHAPYTRQSENETPLALRFQGFYCPIVLSLFYLILFLLSLEPGEDSLANRMDQSAVNSLTLFSSTVFFLTTLLSFDFS